MRSLSILSVAAMAALACGSSTKPPTFTQPAGTAAVNFSVDDTANKAYADSTLADGGVGPSDLQWKGAMLYDPATNKVSMDSTWGGPWAALYDDGPWTAGGHEPVGATAGDHIFGVTVFVTPPTTGTGDVYGYGLNDNLYQTNFGNGWSWVGPNGSFTVAPGATAAIKAEGLVLKKWGTTDIQFVIDTTALAAGTWDTTKVEIKGSGWDWGSVQLLDDGTKGDAAASDHKFTYVLSSYVGAGNKFPHTGLLNTGDKPEWNFVFNGVEYKNSGNALTAGVTVGAKAAGATTFTPLTIAVYNGSGENGNTYVTIP